MSQYRSRLKAALQEGGSGVLPLLKAIKESSDVFPPLKSAVAVTLIISSMVMVCFDILFVYVLGVTNVIVMFRISSLIKRIGGNLAISFSKLLDI
jgi:hypothetical protein